MPEQMEKLSIDNDAPLGAPHAENSETQKPPKIPFKKRGNVRNAILLGIVIVILDIFIYFFLIKPDDKHLFEAIEHLKPNAQPSVTTPSKPDTTAPDISPGNSVK